MVVYDFDFVDVFAFPTKAEAPLVIDANAVLTSYKLSKYNAVLSQRFVAVVRAFSAAAGASFHPADFPAAFSSSAVRLNVLRSFSKVSCQTASRATRVAFVIRRPCPRESTCACIVSLAKPAEPITQPVDISANRCSLRAGSSSASHAR